VVDRKSSLTNGNYWATQALNNANTASIYQVYNNKVHSRPKPTKESWLGKTKLKSFQTPTGSGSG